MRLPSIQKWSAHNRWYHCVQGPNSDTPYTSGWGPHCITCCPSRCLIHDHENRGFCLWCGIASDINNIRNPCQACTRMTPSQPSDPPTPMVPPVYPIQCICSDYFHHKCMNYLVIVDHYTNWLIVKRSSDGAQGLICALRKQFSTFGIAEELALDGSPEFTPNSTQKFLSSWGEHHWLSSVAFHHSNCCAEVAVKTLKRMLTENSGPRGELDADRFQKATLQYRTCPDKETRLSPASSDTHQGLYTHPSRTLSPSQHMAWEPKTPGSTTKKPAHESTQTLVIAHYVSPAISSRWQFF